MLIPAVAGTTSAAALAGPTASVGAAPATLTSLALVSLDWTGSTDPVGTGLTYSATMDVVPPGSASTLVDGTTSSPDFTPDKAGAYSGLLTATDGQGATDTSRWYRYVAQAVGATIGGSTSAHAVLSQQDDAAALTLAATSITGLGAVSWVWTVTGPSGDETAQIITAGADTATPTWAAFTAASGKTCGNWVVKAVATDAAGQTLTFTRTVQVGALVTVAAGSVWMRLARTVNFTAEATADWTAADGAHTIDGVEFTTANGANAATLGPSLGVGLDIGPDNNVQTNATVRTGPRITCPIQSLISGWTFGTPFCIQWVFDVLTELTVAGDAVRCWVGTMVASDVTDSQFEAIIYRIYAATGGPGINISPNTNHGAAGGAFYNDPGVQPASAMELLIVGNGVFFGYAASDPGATVPAPGSMTRSPVSSTGTDIGPLAWTTRPAASTVIPVDADCIAGFAVNRVNTGTGRAALEYMHAWVGD